MERRGVESTEQGGSEAECHHTICPGLITGLRCPGIITKVITQPGLGWSQVMPVFPAYLLIVPSFIFKSVLCQMIEKIGGEVPIPQSLQSSQLCVVQVSAIASSYFPVYMKYKNRITAMHREAHGQWNCVPVAQAYSSPSVITGCSASLVPTPT